MAVLLGKLVVLSSVEAQQQPNHIELEVPLLVDLQNLGGVFLQQDEDALLFQISPKRVASRDGKAGFADFATSVEVQYDGVC